MNDTIYIQYTSMTVEALQYPVFIFYGALNGNI